VVSPAGASGFWQFLGETGKRYGLEVTEEVDERYNLEKATEGMQILLHSYGLFENWTFQLQLQCRRIRYPESDGKPKMQ
jgi:hypothetical protein